MNWKWCVVVLAGLVIIAKVALQMNRVINHREPAEEPDHLLRASPRPEAPNRSDLKSRRQRDAEARDEATRLLKNLQHADGYEAELLKARLSAIFRDWGRVDIEAAEDFLNHSHAAGGMYDGFRKIRDDLVFAAWIGRADVDAADAWRRYEAMWENLKEPIAINPALQPLPCERAGVHLFRAWYRNDPAAALEWLRNHTSPVPLGPVLRVLMEKTHDADTRQRYFTEFCQGHLAGYLDLGFIFAGVAMHDPDQAVEFAHWGRIEEDLMTTERPNSILTSMVQFWSMSQPEQALDFMVKPEYEEQRSRWLLEFIYSLEARRPEMVIRALEKEELSEFRDRFLMDTHMRTMLAATTSWPLLDEELSLPPEERLRVLREALDAADLPDDLKEKWRAEMGDE